jgi:predicted ArsR family transcriptional regulator
MDQPPGQFTRQIDSISALHEPVRRALYNYVAEQHREVSRDEAALAVGVKRELAAFHLDRLAADDLLQVSFRRLTGRRGPGAGRPSKLYRRSDREVAVSLPPRRYELAARLFARVLDAGPSAREALSTVAGDFGELLASDVLEQAGENAMYSEMLSAVVSVLTAYGFEPQLRESALRLENCPFHALATEHRDLVCGMNFAILQGMAEALSRPEMKAVLDPQPGLCCVAFLTEEAPRHA